MRTQVQRRLYLLIVLTLLSERPEKLPATENERMDPGKMKETKNETRESMTLIFWLEPGVCVTGA